jgi:hypothetical protein
VDILRKQEDEIRAKYEKQIKEAQERDKAQQKKPARATE